MIKIYPLKIKNYFDTSFYFEIRIELYPSYNKQNNLLFSLLFINNIINSLFINNNA